MVVRPAQRPGETIQGCLSLRPWYRLDVDTFVRVYKNNRWWYGRTRAAVLAFYVARLDIR